MMMMVKAVCALLALNCLTSSGAETITDMARRGMARRELAVNVAVADGKRLKNNVTARGTFLLATIQQKSTNRFLDAYTKSNRDYGVVTRTAQNDNSQIWILDFGSGGPITIQQLETHRLLDAYTKSNRDYRAVTRTGQGDGSQRWDYLVSSANSTHTTARLRQENTRRYLDAYTKSNRNYQAVTRGAQGDNSQEWVFEIIGEYRR